MSIHEALGKVKRSTCAIGYLTKSIHDIPGDPDPPDFKILGSGFLVSSGVIITNRHVILSLRQMTAKYRLPQERRVVQFTNNENQLFLQIGGDGYIADQFDKERSDVGFINFPLGSTINDPNIAVAIIDDELSCEVGDAVGVYGYAYGEKLHVREAGEKEKVYRSGPILQQGFISGMAPFDSAQYVERLLLDVRTAKGMSGAPVFDSHSGTVIGIHSSGIGADVAFAIPINRALVSTVVDIVSGPDVQTGKTNHPHVLRRKTKQ